MIGGDRRHQCGVANVQRADAVARGDGTDTSSTRSDLRDDCGQGVLRRRMRGVIQPQDGPAIIVIADHARETDDSARSRAWRREWAYSRAATIYGGTSEIQKDIVASRLLGLPRSA